VTWKLQSGLVHQQGVLQMPTEPLELFYCYAHADARLRKRFNEHLTILKREGVISEWHDGDINAGQEWEEEILRHLQSASIILLLISSSFLSSDYCYNIEMQKALERHEEGTARVIPVLLRECDWKIAPFRKLQALPRNGKPVTMWTDKDAAFADVAREIRKVVEELNSPSSTKTAQTANSRKKRVKSGEGIGKEKIEQQDVSGMPGSSSRLNASVLKKAIDQYRKEVDYYRKQANDELGVRTAFQNLLVNAARHVNWKFSPERALEGGIRPDGVLRDAFDLRRGLWEAEDQKRLSSYEYHL
jgi:hypothetical protein